MNFRVVVLATIAVSIAASLSACGLFSREIKIAEVKAAEAVDDGLMPVNVADSFPRGISSVSCWIRWRDAKINTQVTVRWSYETDDIHILDHKMIIPKRDGFGSVTLSMPEGKPLPAGKYRVDLVVKKRVIRSLEFTVN